MRATAFSVAIGSAASFMSLPGVQHRNNNSICTTLHMTHLETSLAARGSLLQRRTLYVVAHPSKADLAATESPDICMDQQGPNTLWDCKTGHEVAVITPTSPERLISHPH